MNLEGGRHGEHKEPRMSEPSILLAISGSWRDSRYPLECYARQEKVPNWRDGGQNGRWR